MPWERDIYVVLQQHLEEEKQKLEQQKNGAKTTDPIDILLEMGIDLDNLSDEEDYLSALIEATNALTIKDSRDPRIGVLQKEIKERKRDLKSKTRTKKKESKSR